ncbi:MAG TPA: hypothetical protein VJ785_18650 [Anaerolineales bacterium]|nr:hypothetical protein [Anaerolineales bacterium]
MIPPCWVFLMSASLNIHALGLEEAAEVSSFFILMTKEKCIEVRQQADQWAFEPGLCQFVEIFL